MLIQTHDGRRHRLNAGRICSLKSVVRFVSSGQGQATSDEQAIINKRLLRIIESSSSCIKWPSNGRQGTPESSRHGVCGREVGCAGDWWNSARLKRSRGRLPQIRRSGQLVSTGIPILLSVQPSTSVSPASSEPRYGLSEGLIRKELR